MSTSLQFTTSHEKKEKHQSNLRCKKITTIQHQKKRQKERKNQTCADVYMQIYEKKVRFMN